MDKIESQLSRLKGRWMTGAPAAEHCPEDWQEMVGTGEDAELRLLALAGQATQVLFRPQPATTLMQRPPLSRLSVPVLPDDLRPRFRRLVASVAKDADGVARLIALLASRGHAAHPADWMPGAQDAELPPIYEPWIEWQSGINTDETEEGLTAESWDSWLPAERRAALRALRRRDPAAARTLVEAKVTASAAEERQRLVEILAEGLSEDDAPFLESLSADRSAKVKAQAAMLLSRLGRAGDAAELEAELADFLEKGRSSFVSRQQIVFPRTLKTAAQRARRDQLFESLTLAGLARALEVSELELVGMWRVPKKASDDATSAFVTMVARTGSDAAQHACADHLLGEKWGAVPAMAAIVRRLDPPARLAALSRLLQHDGPTFELAAICAGETLGVLPMETIECAPAFRELLKQVAAAGTGENPPAFVPLALFNLGLLADAPAARELIRRITALGLMEADPGLTLLHFNASLEGRTET